MFVQLLLIVLGFILLIYGADLLVKGASGVAKKFHISEIIIGLTIVSLGTSLPELIITLVSSTKETHDLIIGNVIGSNLCNLLLILGILTILKPIRFEKSTTYFHLPVLIFVNILVLVMCILPTGTNTLVLSSKEGWILIIIAFIYFMIPFITHLKNKEKVPDTDTSSLDNTSLFKNLIYILIGGFALKYGGDFVVDSSISIAHQFAISEGIIGLTIIALGTSLPELITSIVAVLKNSTNIAEGNIIGSCILNFCFILGTGTIISNITVNSNYLENLILLASSSILICLYCLANKEHILKKSSGFVLLTIFSVYVIRLFLV